MVGWLVDGWLVRCLVFKNAGCGSGWMKMTGTDDEDWFLLDLCDRNGARGLMMRNEGTILYLFITPQLISTLKNIWLSKGTSPLAKCTENSGLSWFN